MNKSFLPTVNQWYVIVRKARSIKSYQKINERNKFAQAGGLYQLIQRTTNKWLFCEDLLTNTKHTNTQTHTQTQNNAHLTRLPVSSDLPLVSLKEFEWLPACLYFLNLSIKIKVHINTLRFTHCLIHTHTYTHTYTHTELQPHSRMPISLCHGNGSTLGPSPQVSGRSCIMTIDSASPTWACRGWWWWRWWPAGRTGPPSRR